VNVECKHCNLQGDDQSDKIFVGYKKYLFEVGAQLGCKNWDLVVYSDCDWTGDVESWISVTGFIIHLLGVTICWRSKVQKGVTLSSSEEEYMVMSEAIKEIRLIFT
jgi:hypothetical protein